jgi:membrane fusion protein (multidrug efflux system)
MEDRTLKPRRRIWLWSAIAVVVGGVVVGGLLIARNGSGDGKKKKDDKEGPTAAPVEVTPVSRGNITTFLETTTTLEARNSATLVANRPGRVLEMLVEEGRFVRQGETLARLDDTEARLAVERADVGLAGAQRDAERGRQLRQQDFLSQKELDDLELKLRNARVALDEAKYNLSQTRLVAPFSGRVTARMINLGETVTAGRECFRLEDFDPMLARLYFPERELARLQLGQPAVLTLDALPGREFTARVSLINPVVDRANGTVKVTLEVRDPERLLRPGNFVRAKLRTGSFENAVVLPRRAMLEEDGERFVFVAHGDTVVRTAIRVGAVSGDTAQILAGLAPGDSVVTVGQGGLKHGARIKPVRL